jgi:hypothetical protein
MTQIQLIQLIKGFVAETSIGPSALRGQGASGVIAAARQFVKDLDLGSIPSNDGTSYKRWLDRQTNLMLRTFPAKARNWGAARKALNLFLRDAYYNQFLNRTYHIGLSARHFEIILDSIVARRLRLLDVTGVLPRWAGLKHVTPADSTIFQQFAIRIAKSQKVHPVHLDVLLWSPRRRAAAA